MSHNARGPRRAGAHRKGPGGAGRRTASRGGARRYHAAQGRGCAAPRFDHLDREIHAAVFEREGGIQPPSLERLFLDDPMFLRLIDLYRSAATTCLEAPGSIDAEGALTFVAGVDAAFQEWHNSNSNRGPETQWRGSFGDFIATARGRLKLGVSKDSLLHTATARERRPQAGAEALREHLVALVESAGSASKVWGASAQGEGNIPAFELAVAVWLEAWDGASAFLATLRRLGVRVSSETAAALSPRPKSDRQRAPVLLPPVAGVGVCFDGRDFWALVAARSPPFRGLGQATTPRLFALDELVPDGTASGQKLDAPSVLELLQTACPSHGRWPVSPVLRGAFVCFPIVDRACHATLRPLATEVFVRFPDVAAHAYPSGARVPIVPDCLELVAPLRDPSVALEDTPVGVGWFLAFLGARTTPPALHELFSGVDPACGGGRGGEGLTSFPTLLGFARNAPTPGSEVHVQAQRATGASFWVKC